MSTTKLLPCPHCGREAGLGRGVKVGDKYTWIACCTHKGCVSSVFTSKEEALAAYNKRTAPSVGDVIKHLSGE